jgi:hypothetical protein
VLAGLRRIDATMPGVEDVGVSGLTHCPPGRAAASSGRVGPSTAAPTAFTGVWYDFADRLPTCPVNGSVYVTMHATNEVSAITALPSAGAPHTIPVGASPKQVAASPTGSAVYVANEAGGSVSLTNPAGMDAVAAPDRPTALARPAAVRVRARFGHHRSVPAWQRTTNRWNGLPQK